MYHELRKRALDLRRDRVLDEAGRLERRLVAAEPADDLDAERRPVGIDEAWHGDGRRSISVHSRLKMGEPVVARLLGAAPGAAGVSRNRMRS